MYVRNVLDLMFYSVMVIKLWPNNVLKDFKKNPVIVLLLVPLVPKSVILIKPCQILLPLIVCLVIFLKQVLEKHVLNVKTIKH